MSHDGAQDDDGRVNVRQRQPCQTADAIKRSGRWDHRKQSGIGNISLCLLLSLELESLLQSTVYFAGFNVTAADLVELLDGQRAERHF